MKQLGKDIGFAVCIGVLIPGMMLNMISAAWNRAVETERQRLMEQSRTALPVRVLTSDGIPEEQDMDDYLVGVVLAEMPASFEEEALKAQSVVARTYARKAWETGGKHGDGSVCTDPSCCQGWKSAQEHISQGGREEDVRKICQAVQSTSGQVLLYGETLIEATYFSCSGGRTEDAVAVWGTEFPYLQAVDSPGEEASAAFSDAVTISAEVIRQRLNVDLPDDPDCWIGEIKLTDGGGVDTIVIGGKYFTGTELRSLLGLRSTMFSVSAQPDCVIFVTKGYGHRVGMSQYGANAMAVNGSSCEEILAHYYPGTELVHIIA